VKSVYAVMTLLAVIALVHSYARTAELSGSTHVGIVERVFVEQYPGVYVDPSAVGRDYRGPAWVHVSFSEPLEDGRTADVARVPAGMTVEPGDLIEMRYGADDPAQSAVSPEQDRVTALLRKHS